MKRFTFLVAVAAVFIVATAMSVAAQTTADDAVSGAVSGLYVAPNAETVDRESVQRAVAEAADNSIDLLVVVLADDVDALVVADDAKAIRSGTVLVFTPTAYGAASDELSQSELDAALEEAASALSGPDVADGVAAFVESTAPSDSNWLLIGLGVVILLGTVAFVGRRWESRASSDRREAALAREWESLRAAAHELSDPVIELSTLVELAEREDATARYQEATAAYGDVRNRLDGAPDAGEVGPLRTKLEDIEASLESVLEMVTPGSDAS